MTNLKNLSDKELLERTRKLAQTERETTSLVLEHLYEVEKRRLFSSLGHSSLFQYCVQSLFYSESAAQRRIASMRLLKKLEPETAEEIKSQIQSGSLSLSCLSQAETFFNLEAKANSPLDNSGKKEVLASLQGKTSREADKILQERSTLKAPPIAEYSRDASGERTEIHLVVDQETMDRLEKIRGLVAHSRKMGWGELIGFISKVAWEKLNPTREPSRKRKTESSQKAQETSVEKEAPMPEEITEKSKPLPAPGVSKRLAIPAAMKREVWRRCEGRCICCGSRRFLQIEHIQPVALAGPNDLSNLTLKCFSCNQRAAIEIFGVDQVGPIRSKFK